MDARILGLLIVGLGAAGVVVGLLIFTGAFGWFGRLPGDIRIRGENTRVYIPITSMLLISIALSLLLGLVRKLW